MPSLATVTSHELDCADRTANRHSFKVMVTSREKPATRALSACATECRVLGSIHHRTLTGHQHARPRQRRTRAIVTVRHVCLYSKRGRSVGRDHDAEGAEADVLFISASTRDLTDVIRVHGYD